MTIMKCLVLVIFSVVAASAIENYDGPEWQPIDFANLVPIEETPGIYDETPAAYKPNPRTGRIVGGQEATRNAHPYQVFMAMTGIILETGCGGTVISNNIVLTAAHCINRARSVLVMAGAHNVQIVEPSQQRRTVERSGIIVHPEYGRIGVLNDIGLLRVPSPFVYNNFVRNIALAPANAGNFVGQTAQATGWGLVADGGRSSNVLRVVTVPVVANSVCERVYGNVAINDHTICIDSSNGRGVCSGDSGGPLTVLSNNARLQIGIASFVHRTGCESGQPHVFERVSSHRAWIQQNMN